MTSFEGKTGPYILYTAVRLNSVLKRANIDILKPNQYTLTQEERNLLIEIMDFEKTLLTAYENRATDMIANYAYDLCQLVNKYGQYLLFQLQYDLEILDFDEYINYDPAAKHD